MTILYLKYKFGKIDFNITVSLNLHEILRTSQFKDSKYKYDIIKGFLHSNPDLGKCSSSIQIL